MTQPSTRRDFMKTTAAASAGMWFVGNQLHAEEGQKAKSPNERIQFGCIGIGGKGSSDTTDASKHGEVIGICDIDAQRLKGAANKYKSAEAFADFREMLDKLGDKVDAVTVSTPDHTHAVAAAAAMNMGKHCFCQKPLTHSVYEARYLAELARKQGVKTQMGNQGTASAGLRKAAALIEAGVLGELQEVHVWTNRPVWPQGGDRPAPKPKPDHVAWDLWIGPAPFREYAPGYHPFAWRGWWDFGTGALGDMACHTFNMPFMATNLRNPTAIEAEHSGHNKDSYPKWSVINFDFPATDKRPAIKVTWYDGGKRPDASLLDGQQPARSGALVIGSQGKLYSAGDYGSSYKLLGDIKEPEVEFTRSPGHFTEFAQAIQGGPEAVSNFPDYAGPLTETILLGNLAVWAGKRVEWDAKSLQATNAPEVAKVVKPDFREGWSL